MLFPFRYYLVSTSAEEMSLLFVWLTVLNSVRPLRSGENTLPYPWKSTETTGTCFPGVDLRYHIADFNISLQSPTLAVQSNTAVEMQMLKIAVVMIEYLLMMTSTQGVMMSTRLYNKRDAFDGELLDEFPTAHLVMCLQTCDVDMPLCQAVCYNADSRQCQLLAKATGGQQVTWLSVDKWTVFHKVSASTLWFGTKHFVMLYLFNVQRVCCFGLNFQITF